MPLTEQPSCVTCDFKSIANDQYPMCNTIYIDSCTDRNNTTDHVAHWQDVYCTDNSTANDGNGDNNYVTDVVTDNN
eukprot:3614860-Rhodomonas_salina.4